MEIAVFGLIGVVVGALMTGGTQLFLERRREQRDLRRAKRLVTGELLHASLILRNLAKLKSWPAFPDASTMLPTSAWQENRAHLAGVLDEDLWNQLVTAYSVLEIDRARFATAKEISPDTPLIDEVIEGMKETVRDLERLRRALGGGGGWLADIGDIKER